MTAVLSPIRPFRGRYGAHVSQYLKASVRDIDVCCSEIFVFPRCVLFSDMYFSNFVISILSVSNKNWIWKKWRIQSFNNLSLLILLIHNWMEIGTWKKEGGGEKREKGKKEGGWGKERGGKVGHPRLSRKSLLSFSIIALSKQVLWCYLLQTETWL